MNVSWYDASKSWQLTIALIAVLMLTSFLVACSEDSEQAAPSMNNSVSADDDEAAARYREKVKQRVSASVVSSVAREWGVPEAKIECLLADLSLTQLEDAASDAAVAAVFDKCGVDPAVAE